ncbi:MAG: DUF3794 domain-containing protein [Ruminococcus sp.]|nr:DUF3794 domain-containing protein [Ruminococcus sp.]
MDLKISRETIPAAVSIYDGIQEQPVELDYILPDYYPDIFRLVRCEVKPVITGWTVSGGKLSYELRCDISILYCGEGDSVLRSVTQTQTFQRTIELGSECSSPDVLLTPKTDHINFRAVNKRRLDLRGAVSVKAAVTCQTQQEVISDVSGMNMQLKRVPLRFAAKKLTADKQLRVSEETELSPAQPPVINIISSRCTVKGCEQKLISGKLLAKGELKADVLYSCEKDGKGAVEAMSFTLPYSQIIDIDGIDESFICRITPEVIACEVTAAAGKTGENRALHCEAELRLMCSAVRNADVMVGTDAYSTVYPCSAELTDVHAEQLPAEYSESFRHTAKLAEGDAVPETIYSVWCSPKNINTRTGEDGRSVVISGMLTYSMTVRDSAGMISMPDKDEAFEETIELGDDISGSSVSAEISTKDVSYNISPEGVLTAKADIAADISVSGSASLKAVTALTVDDSTRKTRDGDYAIKLYFGVPGEDVWDIAKRYSTSVRAIMEENELGGDRLEDGGMLLIPIVT